MLYKSTLILMLCASCTPAEVAICEQVAHEAAVAEQAIEKDLEGDVQTPVPSIDSFAPQTNAQAG